VLELGRRGFTIIEFLVVMAVIVAVTLIGWPRISSSVVKADVRAARGSVIQLYQQAKTNAISTNRRTTLKLSGTSAWVQAYPRRTSGSASCLCDTVGPVRNLTTLYGVAVTASPDSFALDARGLAVTPGSQLAISLTKAGYHDSVTIDGYGRITK
jgi:prepilin-type N-terminal cleavage/methylation domain-containing protein